MIDAKTGLLGLIGNPVKHSLSPVFMNYLLSRLEINYRYFSFEVDKTMLSNAINGVKALKLKGLNVTIPYKRKVIDMLDNVAEDAKKIGAVNCILNKNGKLEGYNTDYNGFLWPLKGYQKDISGKNVLLIGSGGAARGIIYALKNYNLKKIYIVNRTERNALDFINWAREIFDNSTDIIFLGGSSSVKNEILRDITLIVNTTPLGMHPNVDVSPLTDEVMFLKKQIVYDIVYNPFETRLLKNAKKGGAVVINGFPMLIAQGLYSLKIWFPEKEKNLFTLFDDVTEYVKNNYIKKRKENEE